MKRLYASIILTVLGSIFLIGWGLDKLVASDTDSAESTEMVLYRQLLEGLSQQLDLVAEAQLSNQITELSRFYHVNIQLETAANIALPISLTSELSQAGGLLLASATGSYLLKALAKHPTLLLQLTLPDDPVQDQHQDLVFTLLLYFGVCSMLVLWLLPLTRRLRLLNRAANQFGAGEFHARVPQGRFSYIRLLEHSFNRMAGQIEKLMADNKMLASSLSHDIRTPMACLRFGIEAAIDTSEVEKKDNYLRRMDEELTRMEEMTSAFLDYASLERQGFHLRLARVDINGLAQSVIEDCQSLATQQNIALSTNLANTRLECDIDLHWFYRALQNLLSNAMYYAKSQVQLSVIARPHYVDIVIEDDGKGIPDDKLAVIFEPFVKLDSNRSREQGHFGLGLAITTKVLSWHDASIKADQSLALCGASFTISLPLKKPKE